MAGVTSLENLAMLEVTSTVQQTSANHKLAQLLTTCFAETQCTVYMETQAAHGQSVVILVRQLAVHSIAYSYMTSMAL